MKNVAIKGKYAPQNKEKFLGKRTLVYRNMWDLNNERDHLIMLLMASCSPSIMQSIIKETP